MKAPRTAHRRAHRGTGMAGPSWAAGVLLGRDGDAMWCRRGKTWREKKGKRFHLSRGRDGKKGRAEYNLSVHVSTAVDEMSQCHGRAPGVMVVRPAGVPALIIRNCHDLGSQAPPVNRHPHADHLGGRSFNKIGSQWVLERNPGDSQIIESGRRFRARVPEWQGRKVGA